ncbi:MAG: YdcF family protein [Flexilinea sp.]
MDLFVYLSKFLPQLIYPASLVTVFLILALVFTKHKKWQKLFLIIALAVLLICGNQFPSALLIRSLETAYPPFDGSKKAEVIVLLGGGTETKEYPRQIVEISGAGDRILYGAHLINEGYGKYLLTGGRYIDWLHDTGTSPASEMAEIAVDLGVPEEQIIIQDKSVNTREEAEADAEILRGMGVDEIILVSSATHMRRAVGLYEAQGLKVIPAPTDYSFSDEEWKTLTTFSWSRFYTYIIPQASNMNSLETALKEYIGIAVYKMRGWMD